MQTEYLAFCGAIQGIPGQSEREWYALLMLGRLMLAYVLQRRGFLHMRAPGRLDGDPDYLRHQLERLQQRGDRTHSGSFYRSFLLRLFHEGLSQRERAPALEELLGHAPYLNASIFARHALEKTHPDIQIPDAAFERLFAFLDAYGWHLNDRPPLNEQEIHSGVLSLLFEKYIHQKPLGAYYTSADITEYISKTTLVPSLFQAAKSRCEAAFRADGPVWSLLRTRPDAYIYAALKKGCELALPPEIEAGIADVAWRAAWNGPAPPAYALPTETWREVLARRQHCTEVKAKLAEGEITSINTLITYNLDILQFALDIIATSESPRELDAFYSALEEMSILDPTCGSGAFLFAALAILELLYQACLLRMRAMIAEHGTAVATPCEDKHEQSIIERFRAILQDMARHSNELFFIDTTIMQKNLYGVDMMEEAVEICKLRLLLTLVSQVHTPEDIELLPDLDPHIRTGNTLVGLATFEEITRAGACREQHQDAAARRSGTPLGQITRDELDRALAAEYGLVQSVLPTRMAWNEMSPTSRQVNDEQRLEMWRDGGYEQCLAAWKASHRPFHWFYEFSDIMRSGGFAVIIGNPPYVEYEAAARQYEVLHYRTLPCGNLYAFIVERCATLLADGGYFGMIIPASASCTDRYLPLQQILLEQSSLHISSYSDQRGKLFDIPHPRLCIVLYHKGESQKSVYSTAYIKPGHEIRDQLFATLTYSDVTGLILPGIIPRYGALIEAAIHARLRQQARCLGDFIVKRGQHHVYYTRKLSWFVQVTSFVPRIVDENDQLRSPSELKILSFGSPEHAALAFVSLNSHLFYWFVTVGSDCRNLNMREVLGLPLDMDVMAAPVRAELCMLAVRLTESLQQHSETRTMRFQHIGELRIQCLFPGRSKSILDEIDRVLARHYGFTDEELDFILHYDSKYRGRNL